jgi:Arc/MetJ-type ribon-helix-helix transcriptional regulator
MTVQIAVKLPDKIIEGLDHLVSRGCYHNRSEAVRSAVAELLHRAERRRIDQAYVEAERSAIECINDEPWEKAR